MIPHDAHRSTTPNAIPSSGSIARKPVKRITRADTMIRKLPTKVWRICQ